MVLASFGRSIWVPLGVHLGGTRPPKFGFLGSGAVIECFFVLSGLWGCFCHVFGTTFGCVGNNFSDSLSVLCSVSTELVPWSQRFGAAGGVFGSFFGSLLGLFEHSHWRHDCYMAPSLRASWLPGLRAAEPPGLHAGLRASGPSLEFLRYQSPEPPSLRASGPPGLQH